MTLTRTAPFSKLSRSFWRLIGAVLGLALVASTCATADETVVDVYVAASLGNAFEQLADDFESNNAGAKIRLNIAGSSTLVRQINAGAHAHVFAPADRTQLDLLDSPPANPGVVLALNRLTLISRANAGTAKIIEVDDLQRSDIVVARCADGVPCGDAATSYLEANKLTLAASSEYLNVRQVSNQVATGQADAGFVYVSDIVGRPEGVNVIALEDAPVTEPAIVLLADEPATDSSASQQAGAFVEFVLSPAGTATLTRLGFEPASR